MFASKLHKGYQAPTARKFTDFRFKAYHPVTVTLDGDTEDFASAIYDWSETDITIFVPRGKRTGQVLAPAPGDKLSLLIPQAGCAYVGSARVTEVRGWGQHGLVTLAMPVELEKRQRRQFFRVAMELPLRYSPSGLNLQDFRDTRTLDLGGGGVKFPVDGSARHGDQVYIQFDIIRKGEVRSIVAMGKVLRIEESVARGTVVAVQFMEITERERQELIEYLHTQVSRQD